MAGISRNGKLIIGARGSELALRQARWASGALIKAHPDLKVELRVVKTTGDRLNGAALSQIGDQGLFVKELEEALLRCEIDVAVHSMKDLQTTLAPGLVIGAVGVRVHPGDALLTQSGKTLKTLPSGARIGTGSPRRKAQLKHFRPDFKVEQLRGNVPTRITRMKERGLDGIVVAVAGLERLELSEFISEILPFSVCLPAVGQGAIGLEIRESDLKTVELVHELDDLSARAEVEAERALLAALRGGCQVPVGALARVTGGGLRLEAMVADEDGVKLVRSSREGSVDRAREVGAKLAGDLLQMGAAELLEGK